MLTILTLAMAAVLALLIALIVTRRAISDRRRRREATLRPPIEAALAAHLAAEDEQPLDLPPGAAARRVLRFVALETVGELRGRERRRLVAVLERFGVVAEAVAELGSRRRRVRRAGAETLRQIGSPRASQALSISLFDRDLDTSLTCAAALAELPEEAPIAAVVERADESAGARPGTVAAVLVTLGRHHPESIGYALRGDRSIELRRLAAAVAGELRLAEQVPALRAALVGSDDELTARAARGLGMIGDAEALEPLLALLDAGERAWFVRLAATDALGAIGDPRALDPLRHELDSAGWAAQAKAARALRRLGAGGEEALRQALGSPLEPVREHARVALER